MEIQTSLFQKMEMYMGYIDRFTGASTMSKPFFLIAKIVYIFFE